MIVFGKHRHPNILVSNVALAPTLLDWAGVPHEGLPGRNLCGDGAGHEVVFAEDGRPWHAMARDERFT